MRRKIKKIKESLDDLLGNPFIYYYEKTFRKLTVFLIVPGWLVIKGSTAPLIYNSSLLRLVFYSNPNGDKTFYNIGISLIAAYIFYIFQVYIPEKNMFRKHSYFSDEHRYLIFLLNQYILAWEQFLGKEKGMCHFHEFSYKLNHNDICLVTNLVTKQTYNETIEALPKAIDRIIENPNLANFDISYREFITISKWVIEGHLKYMDDQFPRWSTKPLYAEDYLTIKRTVLDDMKRIRNRFYHIEKKYGYRDRLNPIEIKAYTGGKAGFRNWSIN